MTTSTYTGMTALCVRSMQLMEDGNRADFEQVYSPEAVNREAGGEPPAARQPGPAGFYAAARWLRAAFSGLRWEIHATAEHDDLGMARQAGWVPPSPAFLLRAAIAKRRARKRPA